MSENSAITEARSADGTGTAVEVSGSGPAVDLVTGALNVPSGNAQLAQLLSGNFAVLNSDRRGCGDSADTAPPYTGGRECEDPHAAADPADEPAVMFGSSSGSIPIAGPGDHGVRASKSVLWEPSYIVPGALESPADYATNLDTLIAGRRNGDTIEHLMSDAAGLPAEFFAPVLHISFWSDMPTIAPSPADDAHDTDGGSIPTDSVRRISVPTVVLDGGTNPRMTRSADAVAAEPPQGERTTVTGQPHDVDPDMTAPNPTEFLSSTSGEATDA